MTGHPTDRPGVVITSAPQFRTAWALAQTKVERHLGHAPMTTAEWNAVTAEYGRLTQKHQGIPVPCPRTEPRP